VVIENAIGYVMLKKKLLTVIIILLTLLLLAIVIWVYDKRIENIEMNIQHGYGVH
jgi:hypothetical protein